MPKDAREPGRWTTDTYRELRRNAAAALAREPRRHTLAPTELVHEAWMKLRSTALPADGQGLALAARAMREALVDHARRRSALKRGEGRAAQELAGESPGVDPHVVGVERDAYVVALDAALAELAQQDSELARLVELRFFAGLSEDELARALGLSPRTLKRRWQLAKGWLHQRIQGA